jgi:hypothetical protein
MNVFLFAVGVGRGREWELEMIRGCFGEAMELYPFVFNVSYFFQK